MKVRVLFDHPTIEGMIYKGTEIEVKEEDINTNEYYEKIKGKTDTGKIIWIPAKLLEKI
ncbi:hypothetical protein HOE22_08550 [Candidatus Woesearchaeota archaeon]|jgi:hypothetical protein|nr:hypothetical protein [Candidatus Woesearchaeota archaeon]